MYKISFRSITRTNPNGTKSGVPEDPANSDYQQFIQDVAERGISIVEGPDIVEPSYRELRQSVYPSLPEQQDMQYWDGVNGTTIWQDTITAIKEQYPKTITGGTTIGPVPDWVQQAADQWLFDEQLREYIDARGRLAQYILSEGRPKITEEVIVETQEVFNETTGEIETVNTTETVVVQTAIDPLPETVEVYQQDPDDPTAPPTLMTVRNPEIVKDEEERAAAQAIIDKTPQGVVEAASPTET